MKQIDPEAACTALKTYLEAHTAAIGANDPSVHAETRQRAFERLMDLITMLGLDLIGERLASARIAQEPFSPSSSWGDEAEANARVPFAPLSENMDREEAARQRRVAAHFLLDFERLLPPVLARNFATALLLENLGGATPLLRPYRVQGMTGPLKSVVDIVIVLRVYWLAGYRGETLDEVLRAEGARARDMDRNVLNKIVRRHNLRPYAQAAHKAGEAARAAGKPEITPYAADYDLERLTRITRDPGK